MTTNVKRVVERAVAGGTALALGSGVTIFSLLTPQVVHAFPTGGQVQSRAIYMSKSTPGATGVSYQVSFKPASTAAIRGIILDFCAESPIVGDSTCTKPAGLDVGGVTPTFTNAATTAGTDSAVTSTGLPNGAGSWVAAGLNNSSGYRTLKLTNADAGGSGALSTSTLYNFTLTNVTNPTQATAATNGTFYARLITYTSNSGNIASYAPGTEGSADAKDYGGFALSTAYNVSITTKVQETLSFCTSGPVDSSNLVNPLDGNHTGVGGGSSCTAATTPSLTIGHGTPQILSETAIDGTSAYTQASTNASTGLAIRMHATNACANAGLSTDGGTNCNIKGIDNTAAATQLAGTTFFGLMVGPSSTTTGVTTSTGTITPDLNYNAAGNTAIGAVASNAYGMDNTANSGVTSTYGDLIASSTGAISQVNNELLFAATAGLTVPAGIYQGSESLIATGTF